MFQYFTGLITSSVIFISIFISMGFQYGGTQHFNDIVANSITLVDKNGFGGSFKLLDNDGESILSIKDGKIKIFNQSGEEVITILADNQGRGNISLKKGGYLDTYNEYDNKTGKYGTNNSGNGSVFLYDRFGNRGWFKSGKSS